MDFQRLIRGLRWEGTVPFAREKTNLIANGDFATTIAVGTIRVSEKFRSSLERNVALLPGLCGGV